MRKSLPHSFGGTIGDSDRQTRPPLSTFLPGSLYCSKAYAVALRHALLRIGKSYSFAVQEPNLTANFPALTESQFMRTTARRRRQAFRRVLERTAEKVRKVSNKR